uniref:Fibrinogen C domain-containing protein 1 n=1 Tax=Zeugodacus cucurbitae TaxID=28588 RepID=A0A0A1XLG9_ZEUCU
MEPIAIDTLLTVFNIMVASPGSNIQLNSQDIDVSSLMRFGGDDNLQQTCEIQEISNLSGINDVVEFQTKANKQLEDIISDIKAINTHISTTNSNLCSQRKVGELAVKLPQLPRPFSVRCDNNQYGGDWLLIAHRYVSTVLFRSDLGGDSENNGIGEFHGEYFIGFDKLRAITDSQMCELLIVENDERQKQWYDHYQTVAFGANNKVKLLGKHSTNRGDNSVGLLVHAEAINKKLKLYLYPNTEIKIYLRKTSLNEPPIFKAA